jgi:hypothetical protein
MVMQTHNVVRETMLDPTIKLYEPVRITKLRQAGRVEKGDIREPRVGDVAWVIEIFENPPGYYLECSDREGMTEWLQIFSPDEIELENVV